MSDRERERIKAHVAMAEMEREELVTLQKETVRALQTHSTAFFNRVYSEDFLGLPRQELM
jgi:hypothetical protein